MPPKSKLWKHFDKTSSSTATCRYCGQQLKTCGNTTNLKSHLKSKHPYVLQEPTEVSPCSSSSIRQQQPSKTLSNVKICSLNKQLELDTDDEDSLIEKTLSIDSKSPTAQKTIKEAFKTIESFKEGGSLSHKITQAIIYMLCKDGEPIYMVEHKGFLHLMKTLAPQYKVPTRKTMKKYIEEKYDVMTSLIRERLSGKKCTLTTDVWTDNSMESYLSLTVHYFDGNDGIESSTLGVWPMSERHTSEYLAEQLTKWCKEWDIKPNTDDVTAVVSDNCANIVKAIDIAFGSKKFIPCFAHTINLVVENCLKLPALAATINKAKAIVKWFHQSTVASDELRKMTDKKLTQSVPTRWNSTFYMLTRLIELRPFVNDIINRHPKAPPMLTASELEDVNELIVLLEPFEAATKKMSGETYLTSSLAIPIVSIITSELNGMKCITPTAISALAETKKEMVKRFGSIEHSFLLAIATVLDPRFKRMYFADPNAIAKIINFLSVNIRKSAKELAEQEGQNSSSSGNEDAPDPPEKKKKKDLFALHNKTVEKTWQKRSQHLATTTTMPEELSLYLGAPPEKIEAKPLAYWRDNATTYPNLSRLANVYLTTMATSVPSERLFSKAGEIKNKKRNRIKAKWLSKLLFLQSLNSSVWGVGD